MLPVPVLCQTTPLAKSSKIGQQKEPAVIETLVQTSRCTNGERRTVEEENPVSLKGATVKPDQTPGSLFPAWLNSVHQTPEDACLEVLYPIQGQEGQVRPSESWCRVRRRMWTCGLGHSSSCNGRSKSFWCTDSQGSSSESSASQLPPNSAAGTVNLGVNC